MTTRKITARQIFARKGIKASKTETYGSGLTAHDHVPFDLVGIAIAATTDKQLEEAFATLMREATPNFLEKSGSLKLWARGVLDANKMPSRSGFVVSLAGGAWRWYRKGDLDVKQTTIVNAFEFARKHQESLPWFAATVLQLNSHLQRAVKQKNAAAVGALAWQLGALQERIWWKCFHEKAAIVGSKTIAGAKKGSRSGAAGTKAKGAIHKSIIVELALAMIKKNPKVFIDWCLITRVFDKFSCLKFQGIRILSSFISTI